MVIEPLEARTLLTSVVAQLGAASPVDMYRPAVTPDDRYLAFVSNADLQDQYGDDSSSADIFLRDNSTGAIELITRADGQAVGGAEPSISADGRYIAFSSGSTKLTPQLSDLNNSLDVFVYDRVNGAFQRVSIPPASETHDFPGQFGSRATQGGAFDPRLSADGKRVIFSAGSPAAYAETPLDYYLRDLQAGVTFLIAKSTASEKFVGLWEDAALKHVVTLSMGAPVAGNYSNQILRMWDYTDPANPVLLKSISIPGTTQNLATATVSGDGQFLFYFLPDPTGWQGDIHRVDFAMKTDSMFLADVEVTPERRGVGSSGGMTSSDDGARLIYSNGRAYFYDSAVGISLPLAMDYRGFTPAAGQTTAAIFSLNGHKAYFLNDQGRLRLDDSGSPFGFRLYERDDLDVGTIRGQIWLDANGNQLLDPLESPRAAGTLFLDLNNSGSFDSGEPIAIADSTGNYEFPGLAPGSYAVRPLVPVDSVLSFPQPRSQFNIELNFAAEIPQNVRDGIQQAADRWMKVIVNDLPDVGDIDDLRIDVVSEVLGENILATGGPDQFREGSNLPYHGVITWTESSLSETTPRAMDIALHEIAHVLGFGTLWQQENLIGTQLGVPVYTGQAALAMYKFSKDPGAKGIPLEDPGDGAVPSHWATSWAVGNDNFFDIMASYISQNVVGRFISTVTMGAMQDLGYQVNYAQTDFDWYYTYDKYPMLRKDAPVSADAKSYSVTVVGGQVQGGLDFGIKPKSVVFPTGAKPLIAGTISGTAFIDTNRNGRKDRGEAVLKCTIFFDLDRDGVLDSNEPRIKIKTGAYRFTNVPEGTWRLSVLLPKGLKLSPLIKPVKITASKPNVKLNLIARRK